METLLYVKPQKSTRLHTPGNQGVVGTTYFGYRLKQTDPNFPRRFKKGTVGAESARYGSDTSAGDTIGEFTGTRAGDLHFRKSVDQRLRYSGRKMTDILPNQERTENPVEKQLPYYSWTLLKDQTRPNYGSLFQELPHGFSPPPGALLRGNNYPSTTIIQGRNGPPTNSLTELVYKDFITKERLKAINETKRYSNKEGETKNVDTEMSAPSS